ncbi:MAG: sigma-70 family RNA polymerase sigma factor [Deinococcus sp.]|nr:sigma-70 family RNA polymerase sigma factor [Deinococcus sp.]
MQDLPDEALVVRYLNGDASDRQEAFEALFARYQGLVLGYCLRRLRPHRQDAQEAAQDAMRKVFRSLHTYRGRGTFKSWVLSVTANVCKDHWHRLPPARPNYRLDGEEVEDLEALERGLFGEIPDGRDPAAEFDRGQLARRFWGVLSQFRRDHPRELEVLELRWLDELSHAEIAALLGTSPGAARVRYTRACERLRQYPEFQRLLEELCQRPPAKAGGL